MALTTTIKSCARCGQDHKDLAFKKMLNPVDDDYAYWAPCPTTGDPILLRVTS